MKILVISMVVGAALCSVMSMPASAMPMSNLAAAASDLAVGESARYPQHPSRLHHGAYGYGGYGSRGYGYGGYGYGGYGYGGYGYGNYGGYRYGPSSYRYGSGL